MPDNQTTHLNILKWAEEDRPREKLSLKGKSALSNAELLGILLGSGSRSQTAVDLAKQILSSVDNDLNKLAKLKVSDLKKFNGVGDAKAISIVSALEIGRRRKDVEKGDIIKISGSADVWEVFKPNLLDLDTEEFWIIMLNRANHILKKERISIGGVSGTVVDPKIVFSSALQNLASSIIMVHNHPSGNLKPSQSDLKLTKKMVEAGALLEIPVIDHIIFSDQSYFSFADENLI